MEKYSIEELKEAYIKLYWSNCARMMNDVILELRNRLSEEEYGEFILNN